jgi:DNA-binding XRE family transcriptional regulator
MAKVKAISHEYVMKTLLDTPEAIAAFEEAKDEFALLEQLTAWRTQAGLTKADVAERMGVKPPAINRIENNVTKASWQTLKRYAAACGVELGITVRV